jgi:hypothetical protein
VLSIRILAIIFIFLKLSKTLIEKFILGNNSPNWRSLCRASLTYGYSILMKVLKHGFLVQEKVIGVFHDAKTNG